jgi:hypothetical protein
MVLFPLLPIGPSDVKGALQIERKIQAMSFTLGYACYAVGVGKLAGRPWPHLILALFVASIHIFLF